MTFPKQFFAAQDEFGRALPGATFTVYTHGTLTLATIYGDDDTTPLANPGAADAYGNFGFSMAGASVVDITVTDPGVSPRSYNKITFSPLSGGGGGGSVDSVTAGDASITVNNTDPANPTVAVATGGVAAAELATNAVTTVKITDANVTLAKLANLAHATVIGRKTSGTGVPEALSMADLVALGGTPDGTKFLADDGTLKTPSGGGGGGTITDWASEATTITAVSSNPTKGTTTADLIYWRRVGDSMEIRLSYEQATAGTNGTGIVLFALPAGAGSVTIDGTKCRIYTGNQVVAVVGNGCATDQSTGSRFVVAIAYNTTHFRLGDMSTGPISSSNWSLGTAKVSYSVVLTVPITEWA